jgi:hypothetical protein
MKSRVIDRGYGNELYVIEHSGCPDNPGVTEYLMDFRMVPVGGGEITLVSEFDRTSFGKQLTPEIGDAIFSPHKEAGNCPAFS